MKSLWVAIIAVAVLVSIVVAGKLYTRSTDEVVTFAQLPANYQVIPVYPSAQNVWRGSTQERLGTRLITFTTSDSYDKVMGFYRSMLESSGWRYDTRGYVIAGCVPFTSYNGDFYINAEADHVWVADKSVDGNVEYQIFKVSGSFSKEGLCP
jgi:hypothetical protein